MMGLDLMRRIFDANAMDVEIRSLIWRCDLVAIYRIAHR